MTVNLQALKTEQDTNPVSMPYLPLTAENDVANSDIINNIGGGNPRTVNNEQVDTGKIRAAIEFDWFDGLVVSEQQWFEWLTANGFIDVNDHLLQKLAGIPTANNSIWAAADRTPANAAMTALMQRQTSRADEISDLLGAFAVTPGEWRDARLLP